MTTSVSSYPSAALDPYLWRKAEHETGTVRIGLESFGEDRVIEAEPDTEEAGDIAMYSNYQKITSASGEEAITTHHNVLPSSFQSAKMPLILPLLPCNNGT